MKLAKNKHWILLDNMKVVKVMLKSDEVDYCTKCTVKPIVKEHMCEKCYIQHNAELRLFALGKLVGKKFGNLS